MEGYSLRALRMNSVAAQDHIGVKLGRLCIAQEVSVINVAKFVGVSRECVYKWFFGRTQPKGANLAKVEELITKLSVDA